MPELNSKIMNPTGEYLSGGVLLESVAISGSALAFTNDDIIREYGYTIYEEMANDPQVAKSINVIKIGALGNDLEIFPAVGEEHKDYKKYEKVAEFCKHVVENLEKPIKTTLEEMLDAVIYGHKVAEVVYKLDTYKNKTVLVPYRVKPKPITSFNFVVDKKMNVLGVTSATVAPQEDVTIVRSSDVTKTSEGYRIRVAGKDEVFVNRDKFMILSFRTKDGDPRGKSFLRPAFNAWYLKTQIYPEYLRFLLTCSIPLLIGFTPETDDGKPLFYKDPEGQTVQVNPVQALRDALMQARNATALALRGGSKVTEVGARSSGVAFYKALEVLDEQIDKAILLQTLATSEGRYQSRAASDVHMSVLDLLLFDIKGDIINMIKRDLLEVAIRLNLGKEYTKYMPKISLGDTERREFSKDAAAVATLFQANYFTPEQIKEIDAMLGLPIRKFEKEKVKSQSELLDQSANRIIQLANAKAALTNIEADTSAVDEALKIATDLFRSVLEETKNDKESAETEQSG